MFGARFIFLAPLLLIAGCGYQSGAGADSGYHWDSLYRPGVHTVAVPIFRTSDYTRGVEFAVTKAVINQLEANTPYKVVAREKADTILEGEIVRVNVNTISRDSVSGLPQEQLVSIVVSFVWKDLRSGKILCERRGFEAASTWKLPPLNPYDEGSVPGRQKRDFCERARQMRRSSVDIRL